MLRTKRGLATLALAAGVSAIIMASNATDTLRMRHTVEHSPHNVMHDPGEIAHFHDRCSDLMRELLDALAAAPDRPRPFPQIEDAMGWPRRRIASVLGGVSRLRHREFGGRRPYHFLDDRRSESRRWEMWMDAGQAAALAYAGSMATPQHPIGSGFGYRSTAAEVLEGIDLSGRLAIVTGGYSGLGIETTKALAGAGAHVVVPARRPDAAREALGEGVEVDALDLGDLDSVRAFAERFLGSGRTVDILINNAAIMACPETRVGPGWEAQFATNHLGHFALANLLWPALVDGGARVVALTSTGHKLSGIRFDDLQFETGYDKWQAYGQAKSANSLFAVQLDALGRDAGVRAFAAHPGGIMTPLQRHLSREEMTASGWLDADGNPDARFKTPEQGASTSTWAATSPALDGMGGVYCENCDIAEPTETGSPTARIQGVDAHAIDPETAARLWTVSAELTGVDAFAAA
jgi:NAD(P)-dependent dehydrogenase (short-subunit alcohol dehydrogenase family)